MTSVAVVGPGAIGASVAAWLLRAGTDVVVCARTPFSTLRVETPHGTISVDPVVATDPRTVGPVDWVLLAVKAYDVEQAAGWLTRLVGPDTRVAALQNGVEHVERVAPYVPAERIVPVVVDIPAERSAPGVVLQSKDGTLVVPASPAGDAFVALFADTPIAASVTEDFVTTAWRKLALNAAGAVCAVLRQPSGIARQDAVADLIRAVVAETVLVGRAEGAELGDELPDAVVDRMRSNPPLFVNSLQADRMAGRRTEVDARNGVVVRRGEAHGIATPLNHALVTLIEAQPVEGAP